jgi:undecaprenyl-diphosphatase
MNLTDTLVLALLQGVTEFFPVSSSGHLVLLQYFLGLRDVPILFDLVLHLGTAAAIVIVYAGTIGEIVRDFFLWIMRGRGHSGGNAQWGNVKLVLFLAASVVVTGGLGLAFKDTLSSFYYRPPLVPLFLTITGMVLLLTAFVRYGDRDIHAVGIPFPLVVGAVQACAILPGISRSGTTIAAGLFLGARGAFASSYSFFLSIPSILGASLYEYLATRGGGGGMDMDFLMLAAGFAVSLFAGYASLRLLIRFVMRGKIYVFSFYCFALSIAGVLLIH